MGTGLSRNFWHPQFQWENSRGLSFECQGFVIEFGRSVFSLCLWNIAHVACSVCQILPPPFCDTRSGRTAGTVGGDPPVAGFPDSEGNPIENLGTEIAIYFYNVRPPSDVSWLRFAPETSSLFACHKP